MTNYNSSQHAPILVYAKDETSIQSALNNIERPILFAQNKADTVQQFDKTQAVLLILDNIEHCLALREQVDAPILMISNNIDSALDAGADDCIPMHPKLILRRVECLLQADSFTAYDNIPAMIHSLNRDGVIRYVNLHWQNIMGYHRDEVIGKPLMEFLSETSRKVLPRMLKIFWKTGTLRNLAYRYVKKNGETLDVLVDSNLQNQQQNITVLRDITELKTAERSLRESRSELQSILRALPDEIVVVNRQGGAVRIESEGYKQYGAESGDFYGQNVLATFPPEVKDKLINLVEQTLSTNSIHQIEYNLKHKNEASAFHVIASPLSHDEVVLITRDLTGQHRAENSLKESEERYRSLFKNATDAIFVVDLMTGNILQANPQASTMLGYSHDELLTMAIEEIEGDQISIFTKEIAERDSNDLLVQTQYRRNKGDLIDVEISSRVISQNDSHILISFVRDISGHQDLLKEIEHQRNLAEALLDTANALNEAPNIDDVLDIILQNISRIIPHEGANIMMIEDDNARIIRHLDYELGGFSETDISSISLPLKKASNLKWIVDNKKALRVDDTHNSPHFNWVDSTTSNFVLSLLTAPIITDGEVVGFINLDSTQFRNFSEEQETQLMAFANQAAIAMRQANLVEQLRNYTEQLEQRVSERTKALGNTQKQLADERNLLRLIIDTIPDSIYVKDAESRFIIANKTSVSHKPGLLDESQVIGKTDFDFYPHIAEGLFAEEQAIIKGSKPQINKSEIYHKDDGTVAHVLVMKLPLIDSNGEITGIIGINHDITQLRQAEARLDQIIKSARCLLWSAIVIQEDETPDYMWDYKVVNDEAAQRFFPLQTKGMTYTAAWLATIPPEEQKKRDDLFLNQKESDTGNYHLEYYLALESDEKYWLSEDVIILKIAENRWSVVGVCTDITVRKTVEQVLHELNEQLEQRVEDRTLELSKANAALVAQVEERKKAEASERQQRIIAEALRDGTAKLATTLDHHTIFAHLLNTLKLIIPHDASNIMLIEDTVATIVHSTGYSEDINGRQYNINMMPDILQIQTDRLPSIINDVRKFSSWQEINSPIRSNMSIPIIMDNIVIGVINLDSWMSDNFSQEQTQWLITFGEQAGLAIRNVRYTAELEERVKERTLELELEQAQLKAILDGVADGVVYTDMERNAQYVNRALAEVSGFAQEEWKAGIAPRAMSTISEDTLSDVWDRILRWLETHTVWTGELEFKRKDGSLFDAGMARTAVKNQEGEVLGVVTVIRDISDAKRLEAQKARFITTAAHELRTPIANLKTRLFLMKRTPDRFMEHVEIAEAVINLMQNLVEHMFDLSRFERGIIEVNKDAIQLQKFLRGVIQFQSPMAERLDVELKLDMPDDPIILNADPFRLTQVITNLIGNALKYTPPKQDIIIRTSVEDDSLLLDVCDKGSGIAPEHLPNLFQPFYQVSNNNKGAGLGLAIVYEIIKAHGGDITVESELDIGTTFHISLPLNQTELESS